MQLKDAQRDLLGCLGRGMLSLLGTIEPDPTARALLSCVHSGDSLVASYSSWIWHILVLAKVGHLLIWRPVVGYSSRQLRPRLK